jgi:hypothetical protein
MSSATLMRIFGNAPRPRPRNCYHLRSFPPASRAPHPQGKLPECHLPADEACEGGRLNLTAGAALTHDAHEEISETVIEPLDVRQYAHARMVLTADGRVYSVPTEV